MTSLSNKVCPIALILAVTSAASAPAWGQAAPDERAGIAACAKSFEQAQVLRNSGKYLDANQEALKCAQPQCGNVLTTECSKLYIEIRDATPSVVLSAADTDGMDVPNVQVSIDGAAPVSNLDGRPIPLDPGNHSFDFTATGFEPFSKRLTLLAGERFRPVSGELSPAETEEPTPAPAGKTANLPQTPTAPAQPGKRRVPAATFVFAGIGVAGVGGFVALRLLGSRQYSDLQSKCSPDCTNSQVDSVRQKYALSYVSLGIGAAAALGALGFYVFAPRTHGSESALLVAPTPGGASAQLVTSF